MCQRWQGDLIRGGRMTPELKKAIIKAIEAEARRNCGDEEE